MLRGTGLFGSLGSGRRRFEDVDTGLADLCVGLERFEYTPWVVQNELVLVSRFSLGVQAESLMILVLFYGREAEGGLKENRLYKPLPQFLPVLAKMLWYCCNF